MIRCPKCHAQLIAKTHDHIPVAQCEACLGLWLSTTGLLAQTTGDPHDAASGITEGLRRDRGVYPAGEDLPCPACQRPMRAHELAGVMVEHCDVCAGIFLDHGELVELASRVARVGGPFRGDPIIGGQRVNAEQTREIVQFLACEALWLKTWGY